MSQLEKIHKMFRAGEPAPVFTAEWWQVVAVIWKELQHLRKVVGDLPINPELGYYNPTIDRAKLDDPA